MHSVRVLDVLGQRNISLQTLDGVLCHNGEMEQQEYQPKKAKTFADLDTEVEMCYQKEDGIKHLVPGTLEACVMRICDIIAYLGKDRQDAVRLHLLPDDRGFNGDTIGSSNAEIINNMVVNIIENSYGKPYLSMDEAYFNS